jgi:hypothetical protein
MRAYNRTEMIRRDYHDARSYDLAMVVTPPPAPLRGVYSEYIEASSVEWRLEGATVAPPTVVIHDSSPWARDLQDLIRMELDPSSLAQSDWGFNRGLRALISDNDRREFDDLWWWSREALDRDYDDRDYDDWDLHRATAEALGLPVGEVRELLWFGRPTPELMKRRELTVAIAALPPNTPLPSFEAARAAGACSNGIRAFEALFHYPTFWADLTAHPAWGRVTNEEISFLIRLFPKEAE